MLARQRGKVGKRWRFKEEYVRLSHEFGAYLDLLSLIPGGSAQVLEQATAGLAATLRDTNDEGEWQWCLWKFEGEDGVMYAGVSGPYALAPPVGPLEGSDAFSNFAEWNSATAEQHFESVLETLRDWRMHRNDA